jgi:hypothetical protein
VKRSLSRILAASALLAAGCQPLSDADAQKLVTMYLTRLVEAYRASDAEIAAPVVSDREALKLTGLVGVKRDANLNLDAELLEIAFGKISRKGKEVLVETRERWHYRDRQIGTGKQVGEESFDSYHLRYHLAREKDRWVVAELEFVDPPQVGRKSAPMTVDARVLHGLPPPEEPAPESPPQEKKP